MAPPTCRPGAKRAASLRCGRRWLLATGLTAAATVAGLALSPSLGSALVGAAGDADGGAPAETRHRSGHIDVPSHYAKALAEAWQEVESLAALVERQGIVSHFGRRAEAVLRRGIDRSGAAGAEAERLEKVLDLPLRALFHQQLQTLLGRAVDLYDSEVTAKPNPLEAGWAAERLFLDGAADLVRPGSDWVFEAERQDLVDRVRGSYGIDSQIVDEQIKQGRGKQVTIEVIRKLQQQAAAVQREAETRGAFPWNVKWQYMVENSPLGFRGQYTQGRSVVELLLMPHPDPRLKKNLLNRIGPLNLAVAFDMLL